MKFLILLILSISPASAGLYLDIGTGWVNEVTVNQSFSGVENQFSLPLDSWFILFRGGYEINGYHFEFESIGTPDRSFETIKIYRRFNF